LLAGLGHFGFALFLFGWFGGYLFCVSELTIFSVL